MDKTTLDYEAKKTESQIVWGYFSCSVPSVAFIFGIGGFGLAFENGVSEKAAGIGFGIILVSGCAAGIAFGVAGIIRDRRKRMYSYLGIILSLILVIMMYI